MLNLKKGKMLEAVPYHRGYLPQDQGWSLGLPSERQCDAAGRTRTECSSCLFPTHTAHSVCVDQHQSNRVASWLCSCPPSAGERCLCPISVRSNYGKCQYSQQNHISSEDAAGPSGCCIGHGHKREVCAQALGVFHRAGGTPAGLVVGSASSMVSAGLPPPVQG